MGRISARNLLWRRLVRHARIHANGWVLYQTIPMQQNRSVAGSGPRSANRFWFRPVPVRPGSFIRRFRFQTVRIRSFLKIRGISFALHHPAALTRSIVVAVAPHWPPTLKRWPAPRPSPRARPTAAASRSTAASAGARGPRSFAGRAGPGRRRPPRPRSGRPATAGPPAARASRRWRICRRYRPAATAGAGARAARARSGRLPAGPRAAEGLSLIHI